MPERNGGILEQILEELQALRQEIAQLRAVLPDAVKTVAEPELPVVEIPLEKKKVIAFQEEKTPTIGSVPIEPKPLSADVLTALTQSPNIRDLLSRRNLHVCDLERFQGEQQNPNLANLSFFIADNFDFVKPFVQELRRSLNSQGEFSFHLRGRQTQAMSDICHVGTHLRDLGFIKYDYKNRIANVEIIRDPSSMNYISGGWFEIAILEWLRKHPSLYTECLYRVHVMDDKSSYYEFDFLIFTKNGVKMLECKSGLSLQPGEIVEQVRRAVSALNLSGSSGVLMPTLPSASVANRIENQTGAKVLLVDNLERFLKSK
ncbi:MAG: hypothetical protein KIT45_08675 [Fimbriimonadia bacterium]|nr:hypothetical protein [Fimbriimonadia bacterium]